MVKTTGPVNGNVTLVAVEPSGTLHTTTRADTAKLEEPIENGTIVSDIVLALLLREGVHIVRCNLRKEVDILIRVELGHFIFRGRLRPL